MSNTAAANSEIAFSVASGASRCGEWPAPGRIVTYPYGSTGCMRNVFDPTQGCQNTPWFVLMLPQFEQSSLYNAFNFSIGAEGRRT